MPYFPYSRQSKRKAHRGAITARMLANLMYVAGVNHVITIDLHASQMQGFFKCPVDNLVAEPLLAKWIRMNIPEWSESVVVSKNPGGTKRVTSLADALKLGFGIVTTDRYRPHTSSSLVNSVVLDNVSPDRTNGRMPMDIDVEDVDVQIYSAGRSSSRDPSGPIEQDFARRPAATAGARPNGSAVTEDHHRRPSRPRAPTARSRLVNGNMEHPASPLSRSTRLDSIGTEDSVPDNAGELGLHRFRTAQGIEQPYDEDGYEEPADDEHNTDGRARDVITGRLIHGHIVDDDAPSPSISVHSGSAHGNHEPQSSRLSDADQLPEAMMQSFISTASAHSRAAPPSALGGTGDAAHSDEEEEEALKDPEIEHTVTLVGSVRDKPVLIVDDMIDKAGSWIAAAETVVKRGGATKVYCMATHGLFGEDCLRELDNCDEIEAIVVTDSFPIPEHKRQQTKKLVVLDVSGVLSEAIRRNHYGESLSQLYQYYE